LLLHFIEHIVACSLLHFIEHIVASAPHGEDV
jgi:hypothetical protein